MINRIMINGIMVIIIYIFFIFVLNFNFMNNVFEGFDGKNSDSGSGSGSGSGSDFFSDTYVKLYDKVFNEVDMYKGESKIICDYIGKTEGKFGGNEKVKVLDAGVGVGKYYQYISQKYRTYGFDDSANMLRLCRVRNPISEVKIGDMMNEDLYEPESFTHLLCLKDSLYHNRPKVWAEILANFYYWLRPNGYLFIHIYNPERLDPSPRNYSQIVKKDGKKDGKQDGKKDGIVNDKNSHSITHFKNFTHDAWWERKGDGDRYIYNEIYVPSKGESRHYKHTLYFPEKRKVVDMIQNQYFRLVDIISLEGMDIMDNELYVFKKPATKINLIKK